MFNEGNQIHSFMSSSGSGTVINYGSGFDFFKSYGSGSTSQKVTVPTVPVPVPQHWQQLLTNCSEGECHESRTGRREANPNFARSIWNSHGLKKLCRFIRNENHVRCVTGWLCQWNLEGHTATKNIRMQALEKSGPSALTLLSNRQMKSLKQHFCY